MLRKALRVACGRPLFLGRAIPEDVGHSLGDGLPPELSHPPAAKGHLHKPLVGFTQGRQDDPGDGEREVKPLKDRPNRP